MKKKLKYGFIIMGILLVLLIGYRIYLEYQHDLELLLNPQASRQTLMKSVRSHGIEASFLLILLTVVMCAVPGLPTSVIGILIGICYGPFIGSLMNLIGNTGGNLIAISIFGKFKFLDQSNQSNHWVQAVSQMKHPRLGLMVGYMIPVIPSFLMNYTADMLQIPFKRLIPLVIFGVLPTSIIYALGGEALFHGEHRKALILIVSVLGLILLVKVFQNNHQKK